MFTIVTWFSSCLGVIGARYISSEKRIVRRWWCLPVQICLLSVTSIMIINEVVGSLYYKVLHKPKGFPVPATNTSRVADWSLVRIVSSFSSLSSSLLGITLFWRPQTLQVLNRCISLCCHVLDKDIPFYIKASSPIIICTIIIVPNLYIPLYILIAKIQSKVTLTWHRYLNILLQCPEIIVENYFIILCSLISHELKYITEYFIKLHKDLKLKGSRKTIKTIDGKKSLDSYELGEDFNEIHKLRMHHLHLTDSYEDINSIYQLYIAICLFSCLLEPMMNWYKVMAYILDDSKRTDTALQVNNFILGTVNFSSLWVVCRGPQLIENQMTKLELTLQELYDSGYIKDSFCVNELKYMRKQCNEIPMKFEIFGMFNLNNEFFFGVLMTIVSYLTILKQFNVDVRAFYRSKDFLVY